MEFNDRYLKLFFFYINMSQQLVDEMQQNNKISDSKLNEEYNKGSHIILVSVLYRV